MSVNGHVQKDVEAATGVPQPQISRALNGHRKRPTEPMKKLCQYAELTPKGENAVAMAELHGLLQDVATGGPAAAECAKRVLEGLALLLGGATNKGA
jgi:hypothetical protein